VKGNEEENTLSGVSLRWMVREIVGAGVKVIFDEKALEDLRIPVSMVVSQSITKSPQLRQPETNGILINRKNGNGYGNQSSPNHDPQDVEDVKGVKEKITDQLVNVPAWRLLEYFPIKFPSMNKSGEPIDIRT